MYRLLRAIQVTYDLHQVEKPHLPELRDTLVAALEHYQAGPKAIIVQICLALSGLALQVPQLGNTVQDMIERFGQNPATVPVLLQFLTVLPEELNTNTKIPVTVRDTVALLIRILYFAQDQEYKERAADLLTANAESLLGILSVYIQAPGV